jgi:hypothetical protein
MNADDMLTPPDMFLGKFHDMFHDMFVSDLDGNRGTKNETLCPERPKLLVSHMWCMILHDMFDNRQF